MDMANHGFLGKPASASSQIDERVDALLQHQALMNTAARALLNDLRVGLHGSDVPMLAETFLEGRDPAFDPFGEASKAQSELFLAGPGRKKAGEGRRQILAGFVEMLGSRTGERITTALLARHLDSSEAAIYRHFESRTVMFENLIATIENAVFDQIAQLQAQRAGGSGAGASGGEYATLLVSLLMTFAETNPGVSRVMAGDALAQEEGFLRQRMALFFDRFEDALADALRGGEAGVEPASGPAGEADAAAALASALCAFCVGRLSLFARSGFRHQPSDRLDACLRTMLH